MAFAGAALVAAACGSSSSTTGKGGSGGGSGGKGGGGGSGGAKDAAVDGTGGGAGGTIGAGGGGGTPVVTCPTTPQYIHTSTFGAIFDGWSVSTQYSSPEVAPGTDSDGGPTGTKTSIDPNDGSPVNGSLRLDIPFSGPAQTVLLQELYNTPENFTDTIVTAQIKLLSPGVIMTGGDTVRAFLILKSTVAYAYAAGTAVVLDPSADWMTLTIDPDSIAATANAGYTACDIREVDIQIATDPTGSFIPGTILIDSVSITPKHPTDGGTDATDATTTDATGGDVSIAPDAAADAAADDAAAGN